MEQWFEEKYSKCPLHLRSVFPTDVLILIAKLLPRMRFNARFLTPSAEAMLTDSNLILINNVDVTDKYRGVSIVNALTWRSKQPSWVKSTSNQLHRHDCVAIVSKHCGLRITFDYTYDLYLYWVKYKCFFGVWNINYGHPVKLTDKNVFAMNKILKANKLPLVMTENQMKKWAAVKIKKYDELRPIRKKLDGLECDINDATKLQSRNQLLELFISYKKLFLTEILCYSTAHPYRYTKFSCPTHIEIFLSTAPIHRVDTMSVREINNLLDTYTEIQILNYLKSDTV